MLQDISLNLFLGIVSGLLATFLTLFVRSYWQGVVLPWYEERIYQDAHVEGRWFGEFISADGNKLSFIFSLKREGHRVYGEMINRSSGAVYKLQGNFRNMILTLEYSSTALHEIDRGCFTLLLTKNGEQLDGQVVYYFDPNHRIEATHVQLSRANAQQATSSHLEIGTQA